MNQIIYIAESPTARGFLQSLMCRKHKKEEVAGLRLHPWNQRETSIQAGPVDQQMTTGEAA